MSKVIVVGSTNMDILTDSGRLPRVGETILGRAVHYFLGGKGANQAVAAARIGEHREQAVHFFGCVGNDAFGRQAREILSKESLCLHLEESSNQSTGIATIFQLQGDNAIVVIPGANQEVTVNEELLQTLEVGDVLLTQLEISFESLQILLPIAKKRGVTTIVNPAPYDKRILTLLECIDYLTPNETEFMEMLEVTQLTVGQLEEQLVKWQTQHATQLCVTCGEQGVRFVQQGKIVKVPAMKVSVVDTTGAGDTFSGVLASRIAEGFVLEEAVAFASEIASFSTMKLGAQNGMPTYEEYWAYLESFIVEE